MAMPANKTTLYAVNDTLSVVEDGIPKGYYLKARKIEESDIAHAAPCIRETWDWILRQCWFKDDPATGLKRGQCLRTIADIIEGLHWYVGYRKMTYSKSQCEGALEYLRKHHMITTAKTTRGLIITACNYDTYQRIENYEGNSEGNKKATRRQQPSSTIEKEGKEYKEDNKLVAGATKPKPYKSWTDEDFKNELSQFLEYFGRDTLNAFYKYWSEKSATGKMRLQLEKTWETKKRLENWLRIEETKRK